MKHGGGLVMIWGCMTAFGVGAWYKIKGRMNRHLYKFILDFVLVHYTFQYCMALYESMPRRIDIVLKSGGY